MNNQLKLSPPWDIYVEELKAMFGKDGEITIDYDEGNLVRIYVRNQRKADALTKLLPKEKHFGHVILNIQVIPSNDKSDDMAKILEDAFEGNPVLHYVQTHYVQTIQSEFLINPPMIFAVFEKEVVQFYTDNISDIHGLRSTLYQDIAKDIFGNGGDTDGDSAGTVFFCTDNT